jgi:glycogen debranching enzyme
MSSHSWLQRALWFGLFAFVTGSFFVPVRCADAQASASMNHLEPRLALDTESVAPSRFIAVHGRRASIVGYASAGLEVWAYPFQILNNYRVAFRASGATTPIPGQSILSRVVYEPDSVTRIYLGPDFMVREKLVVPLDQPGAILTYKIESSHPVEIEVHAIPVLDLMWPGALGGQSTAWNSSLSAFVLSEPADGYSAVVGSPDIMAHDDIFNRAVDGDSASGLGFTLRPDSSGFARVFLALNPSHAADPGNLFRQLIKDRPAYEAQTAAHVHEILDSVLRVETPDARVNQAIAWAEIALDQAWVCNPDLGCGFVAGYGPSRGARRPQYNWFFAGDGLIATDASIAASNYTRARQELAFILRYQDQKSGMIWHELSQSAGLIDWTGKFPYMYVHVDITFQFLATLDNYVTASGDTAFARDHWESIASAYRYCRSLIDPATALPRIPGDKEGGNEQDRISDDLGLSTSWVRAASAFAHLATLTGHAADADEAAQASHRASAAIPARYWNDQQQFWISGHIASGQNAPERRSSPAAALAMHLFSAEQNAHLLDQLASSSFQTDWGARSIGTGSAGYDPASYAKGSVSALATASLAQAFWSEHCPNTALELWSALLPWTSLDSLGHMHEVLSGNSYRPQVESVPEQTWSSAGYLEATVHGLLGLSVDSAANHIAFAPHLPAQWNSVSVENIKLSDASIALVLRRTQHQLTLEIDNSGAPFKLEFSPQLPLGSRIGRAELDHKPIAATLETHPQETDARMSFDAPHGKSELSLDLQGGVSVVVESPAPRLGMPGSGVHLVGVSLAGNILTIVADVPSDRESHLQLQTEWEVTKAEGSSVQQLGNGHIDLIFAGGQDATLSEPYHRAKALLQFKP